ncbi:MAG: ubiquinone biosynthesis regulatory protein kinase UbiB [Rhodanobacteraceae bacterium]
MRLVPRVARIAVLLVRYRLDELIDVAHLYRPLKLLRLVLPRPPADMAALPRGARLTLALIECGPLFVKFGQILSTRRDLLPADVADELARLQDQVTPFPADVARSTIERALGAPLASRYAQFENLPLASASIAQVHAATLADGREVVVKVLRPDIHARVARDIDLLRAIGELVQRYHPNADKIRPLDVVAEIETTLDRELDLQHEGANASLLKRNFAGSDDLYVPAVVWSHSASDVLTLERVRGIPVDDLGALDAAGIDRIALAEKGIRVFYTQVFRDNFFHADAHAGNIWVDAARPTDPRIIALDFGIMGSLSERDQYWLAENFLALFRRDYRRIAELHVQAGWIPREVNLDELETAVRTVCEPYFSRPLSEISLAEVVVKLFQTARRYELVLQPQLILLQKTLLNIEGVGRLLHPGIDIWATAQPVLERIWRKRRGPRQFLRTLRRQFPEWLALAPEMPHLVHEYLEQATSGRMELHTANHDLKQLDIHSRRDRGVAIWSRLGGALVIASAVLLALPAPGPHRDGTPWLALAAALGALIAFIMAVRRR